MTHLQSLVARLRRSKAGAERNLPRDPNAVLFARAADFARFPESARGN